CWSIAARTSWSSAMRSQSTSLTLAAAERRGEPPPTGVSEGLSSRCQRPRFPRQSRAFSRKIPVAAALPATPPVDPSAPNSLDEVGKAYARKAADCPRSLGVLGGCDLALHCGVEVASTQVPSSCHFVNSWPRALRYKGLSAAIC